MGGKKRGAGAAQRHKTVVYTLILRDGEARSQKIDDLTARTLQGIIHKQVEGTAHITTDENAAYQGLAKRFASHETVNHSEKEYVRGIVHVNFSESYFSLLKRGIIGNFHPVSEQHIQRYLEEFDFRWNRRKITDGERMLDAVLGAEGTRLYYRAPVWLRRE